MNINKQSTTRQNKNHNLQQDNLLDTLYIQNEKLIEIQREDVPQNAIDVFEGYSERFILPEEYKKGNFENYRYIQHDNYKTYIAMQNKILENGTEKDIYIYEQDKTGAKIGHGEIRLGITDNKYFKDKPFVGFTQTEEDFLHQGYGKRRIITMNNITKQVRGLELHSSTLFSHEHAKKIRETLTLEGNTKKYQEGTENNKDRFHFIDKNK